MKYMLDTNICIYIIKKKPRQVLQHFNAYPIGKIGLSSISVAELHFGVRKSQYTAKSQLALEQFLILLSIASFDSQAAVTYGKIRAALESQGTPIGPLDTLIAAHALSLDITLVTNNEREFARIPDLKIANWVHG